MNVLLIRSISAFLGMIGGSLYGGRFMYTPGMIMGDGMLIGAPTGLVCGALPQPYGILSTTLIWTLALN